MHVVLARPRGFCAGVTRAIAIVKRALAVFGAPIYVRHEIVHNHTVVQGLRDKGAIFIDDLRDVPDGATVIFSAHGVPKSVEQEAADRHLQVFDATCPLVKKVHREVARMHAQGRRIIMIGHAGHPEVEATMGQIDEAIALIEKAEDVASLTDPGQGDRLAYVSQTTLSVDDAHDVLEVLKARYPLIHAPKKGDVCYATQNRQDAVKKLAKQVEVILVIGSSTSSNSNRLREVGQRQGARSYLLDCADDLRAEWFAGVERVGVTAGASAPEFLVQGVLERLKREFNAQTITETDDIEESVVFPLPKGLGQNKPNVA